MKKKRRPFEEKTNSVCQVESQLQPGVLVCTDEHNSCLKEMKYSNGTACILFNGPKSTWPVVSINDVCFQTVSKLHTNGKSLLFIPYTCVTWSGSVHLKHTVLDISPLFLFCFLNQFLSQYRWNITSVNILSNSYAPFSSPTRSNTLTTQSHSGAYGRLLLHSWTFNSQPLDNTPPPIGDPKSTLPHPSMHTHNPRSLISDQNGRAVTHSAHSEPPHRLSFSGFIRATHHLDSI